MCIAKVENHWYRFFKSTDIKKESVFRHMEGKLGESGTLDDGEKVGKSSEIRIRCKKSRRQNYPLNFAI